MAPDELTAAQVRAYLDRHAQPDRPSDQFRAYREAAAVLAAIREIDLLGPLDEASAFEALAGDAVIRGRQQGLDLAVGVPPLPDSSSLPEVAVGTSPVTTPSPLWRLTPTMNYCAAAKSTLPCCRRDPALL